MSEHLFVEIARPKVNLTLRILGRRPDGYHELASLVAFATGPADRVVLDCSRPRDITMTGPFAGGIAGVNLLDTADQYPGGYSWQYITMSESGERTLGGIPYYYPLATRNFVVTVDFKL